MWDGRSDLIHFTFNRDEMPLITSWLRARSLDLASALPCLSRPGPRSPACGPLPLPLSPLSLSPPSSPLMGPASSLLSLAHHMLTRPSLQTTHQTLVDNTRSGYPSIPISSNPQSSSLLVPPVGVFPGSPERLDSTQPRPRLISADSRSFLKSTHHP